MGRPSTLPKTRNAILAGVRAGLYPTSAARAAGVPESTFGGWMRDPRPEYEAFRAEIAQAEAEAEREAVSVVRRDDPKWWLEHRHRERWGKPAEIVATASTAIVAIEPAAIPATEVITLTRDELIAISHKFLDAKRAKQGRPPIGDRDLSTLMISYTPDHPAPDNGDGD
jgi:hypothetical protein